VVLWESSIRKLVKLVEESDIAQLEVSSWGRRVKITKRYAPGSNGHQTAGAMNEVVVPAAFQPRQEIPPSATPVAVLRQKESPPPVSAPAESADDKYVPIKSPMVGTFYVAPEPNAPPYVEVGQVVQKGTVVCIVEAMKLMNEIESEVSGRVVKRLVENTQPVEFGQTLFLVEPIA
jgi:acetyl-CoA carboxylase biotin carboxyl carrier protein